MNCSTNEQLPLEIFHLPGSHMCAQKILHITKKLALISTENLKSNTIVLVEENVSRCHDPQILVVEN